MNHSTSAEGRPLQGACDPRKIAPAAAIAGLEIILDEGPAAEPAYPANGQIEAHEAWAFDSASYERAQTARDALASVEAITGNASVLPG